MKMKPQKPGNIVEQRISDKEKGSRVGGGGAEEGGAEEEDTTNHKLHSAVEQLLAYPLPGTICQVMLCLTFLYSLLVLCYILITSGSFNFYSLHQGNWIRIGIFKAAGSGSAFRKTAGSGSAKNVCGSTALVCIYNPTCTVTGLWLDSLPLPVPTGTYLLILVRIQSLPVLGLEFKSSY